MASPSPAVNPLIIHKSLLDSELYPQLHKASSQFKLRTSISVPIDSCVFPKSQITFSILNINKQILTETYQSQLFERFDKLSSMYYSQYVLVMLPSSSDHCKPLLMKLYDRYLTANNIKILPFHNMSDCMDTMISLAQVNTRPIKETICTRHLEVMKDILISEDNIVGAIQELGLTTHEAYVLIDGCGHLEDIAHCSVNDLLNLTSLDKETAKHVVNIMDYTECTTMN